MSSTQNNKAMSGPDMLKNLDNIGLHVGRDGRLQTMLGGPGRSDGPRNATNFTNEETMKLRQFCSAGCAQYGEDGLEDAGAFEQMETFVSAAENQELQLGVMRTLTVFRFQSTRQPRSRRSGRMSKVAQEFCPTSMLRFQGSRGTLHVATRLLLQIVACRRSRRASEVRRKEQSHRARPSLEPCMEVAGSFERMGFIRALVEDVGRSDRSALLTFISMPTLAEPQSDRLVAVNPSFFLFRRLIRTAVGS